MQGLVYDYYVDEKQCAMVSWENRVPEFVYTPNNFSSLFVPTVETTRISHLLDLLIPNKYHVMLVGSTGKETYLVINLVLLYQLFGSH